MTLAPPTCPGTIRSMTLPDIRSLKSQVGLFVTHFNCNFFFFNLKGTYIQYIQDFIFPFIFPPDTAISLPKVRVFGVSPFCSSPKNLAAPALVQQSYLWVPAMFLKQITPWKANIKNLHLVRNNIMVNTGAAPEQWQTFWDVKRFRTDTVLPFSWSFLCSGLSRLPFPIRTEINPRLWWLLKMMHWRLVEIPNKRRRVCTSAL